MLAVGISEATQRNVDSITAGAERARLPGDAGDLLVAQASQAREKARSFDVDSWTEHRRVRVDANRPWDLAG
jgi:hypothetical protein